MDLFDFSRLTPVQKGRVDATLDMPHRFSDGVRTLRAEIEARHQRGDLVEKVIYDGMCDFNRRRFNRMTAGEQRAYEARLKARRYYCLNDRQGFGLQVPKSVFDIVNIPVSPRSLAS